MNRNSIHHHRANTQAKWIQTTATTTTTIVNDSEEEAAVEEDLGIDASTDTKKIHQYNNNEQQFLHVCSPSR